MCRCILLCIAVFGCALQWLQCVAGRGWSSSNGCWLMSSVSGLCCSVLQCAAACCSVLQRAAACWSVLQRVGVCCSVLQCVAACCQGEFEQIATAANWWTVCQVFTTTCCAVYCSVLQRVAACCSVLQCVAVCCSVLQCLAASSLVESRRVESHECMTHVTYTWTGDVIQLTDTQTSPGTHTNESCPRCACVTTY